MTLNLGKTLRDAVDGPSLDEVVGEDQASPAELATLQAQRAQAEAAATSAQQTYDSLVCAPAAGDSLPAATMRLAVDRAAPAAIDARIAAQRQEAAAARLAQQAQQEQAATSVTYALAGTGRLTATTRSWTVAVSRLADSGPTVLSDALIRRSARRPVNARRTSSAAAGRPAAR